MLQNVVHFCFEWILCLTLSLKTHIWSFCNWSYLLFCLRFCVCKHTRSMAYEFLRNDNYDSAGRYILCANGCRSVHRHVLTSHYWTFLESVERSQYSIQEKMLILFSHLYLVLLRRSFLNVFWSKTLRACAPQSPKSCFLPHLSSASWFNDESKL
jgi:hypothetical protein